MHALHDLRISLDSQVRNKYFFTKNKKKKNAFCQFTSNSIVTMATLSGASENETRNNLHYSNDSKKLIQQVLEVIIFSRC